jgi:putative transposase
MDLENGLSKMDLESGYYCIAMDPSSRKYTAFLCEFGLFEWTRMPMGLTNSGATFQRAMTKWFKDQKGKFLDIYVDAFIVFRKTEAEQTEHLNQVYDILKRQQMKIKLKKCEFFAQELEFLGHII